MVDQCRRTVIVWICVFTTYGCGGGSDATEPVIPAEVILLDESFAAAFPGNNWLQLPFLFGFRGGSVRDTSIGNPSPSVQLNNFCRELGLSDPQNPSCFPTASGIISAPTMSLASGQGLSVAVDMLFEPLTGSGSGAAGAGINATTGRSDEIGSSSWALMTLNLVSGVTLYMICPSPTADCATASVAFTSDGRFHTYRFRVASDGMARWERDGSVQLSRQTALSGNFQLELFAQGADLSGAKREYPRAYFDNVRVTRP